MRMTRRPVPMCRPRLPAPKKDSTPRDLLALAREAKAPDALSAAGRQQRFGDLSDRTVARGQIWRAAWDDDSVLVFVTGVDHAEIAVIPVTLDPGAEDRESV